MQQRQLVWLAGALIVLLGVAFVAGTFDNQISTIDVPGTGISGDDIDVIEIVMNDSTTLSLNGTETGWQITAPLQARADSITMARFTENLAEMAFETVVSTSEERYGAYGVNESAKRVTITRRNSKKTFYVGNTGPDFQSFYVRMEGDPRVFLTNGRLSIPDDVDTWRDKTLIAVPAFGLSQVVVTGPDFSYEVSANGSAWSIAQEDEDDAAGDSTQVARWLNRYRPLKSIGFLDALAASELKAAATHQIHFTTTGGSTQTVWFMETEDDLAATVNGSNVTYRLSKSMLESYVPSAASLSADS